MGQLPDFLNRFNFLAIRGQICKPIDTLVFVHGFANSFEDAVFRNAQIVYDLDYQGLSVLYSWSSRGDVAG
jgi:esterase/lipase superfamily enzyme